MTTTARLRRFGVALAAALGLTLLPALPASAHVTISSPDASPGGFGKLVFRVPSESDTANTVALTVTLPADTPFAFVSTGVVPGWTAETTMATLAEPIEVEGFTLTEVVSSVTWTADEAGLAPHEFTEFALSVGPFPAEEGELVFPASQTYSDGEVVDWAETTEDAEHPAPVLTLAAPADVAPEDGAAEDAASEDASEDTSDEVSSEEDSTDTLARVLGIAGIVLGGVALAWTVAGRKSSSTT